MRLARNVRDTRIASNDVGRIRSQRSNGAARRGLLELQRLVRVLEHHVAVEDAGARRELALLGVDALDNRSEPHLRAVTALLVSLATYQHLMAGDGRGAPPAARRARVNGRAPNGRPPGAHAPDGDVRNGHLQSAQAVNGRVSHGRAAGVNGVVNGAGGGVNGHDSGAATTTAGHPAGTRAALGQDRELAAAAAGYIARDLAARQLSEFTSAEGYRLARALARLGDVEVPVERLLTEANQARLHPVPLADAMSHSPR